MLKKQEIALLTRNAIASKAACNEVLQNFHHLSLTSMRKIQALC